VVHGRLELPQVGHRDLQALAGVDQMPVADRSAGVPVVEVGQMDELDGVVRRHGDHAGQRAHHLVVYLCGAGLGPVPVEVDRRLLGDHGRTGRVVGGAGCGAVAAGFGHAEINSFL
jgi:hypothetical protein